MSVLAKCEGISKSTERSWLTFNSSPRMAALTSSSSWLSQSSTRTWSPGEISFPSSVRDTSDPGATRKFNGKLMIVKAEMLLIKIEKILIKAL